MITMLLIIKLNLLQRLIMASKSRATEPATWRHVRERLSLHRVSSGLEEKG